MRRSYKYRIYPTKTQLRILEMTLEGCRYIYNETLALRKEAWEKDEESISYYDCYIYLKIWKEYKEELYDINAQVLNNVQMRVDLAFKSFFRRCKLCEKPGYPRFKGKGRYNSFTYPKNKGLAFFIKDYKLHLAKIGDIKIIQHRQLKGNIKTLTIKKMSTGKWFAYFVCEMEDFNIKNNALI